MSIDIDSELFLNWVRAQAILKIHKENEMRFRKAICDQILDGKSKGTAKTIVTLPDGNSYDVKASAKVNIKLDKELLRSLWKDFSKQERDCIKTKPELVAAEYKKLPPESEFHKAVTESPGAPTLDFKPIKVG